MKATLNADLCSSQTRQKIILGSSLGDPFHHAVCFVLSCTWSNSMIAPVNAVRERSVIRNKKTLLTV